MTTAAQLRAVLGNEVRFFVELHTLAELHVVGGRWPCGCLAEGRGFAELLLRPCPRHRPVVSESMVH